MLGRTVSRMWMGGLLAAALCVPSSAAADSYLVDRAVEGDPTLVDDCTAADDDCSIRGAVKNAGLSAGADTITFADDLSTVEVFPQLTVPDTADGLTIDGGGDITLRMPTNQTVMVLWLPNDGALTGLAVTSASDQVDHLLDIDGNNMTIKGCRFGAAWGSSTIESAEAVLNARNGISGTVIGGTATGEGNEFVGHGVGTNYFVNVNGPNTTIRGNHFGYVTNPSATGTAREAVLLTGDGSILGDDDNPLGQNDFSVLESRKALFLNVFGTGVTVAGNRFNGTRPIVFVGGGPIDNPYPNDPGDADAGAQNHPVVTGASRNGSTVHVEGTLDSHASTQFTIRAWAEPGCHSGPITYIGKFTAGSPALGVTTFSGDLPDAPTGFIRLTAQAPGGSSSQMSFECIHVGDFVVDTLSQDAALSACSDSEAADCSLPGALAASALSANADRIVFADTLGAATIPLAATLEIAIPEVTIDGGGDITLPGAPAWASTVNVLSADVALRNLAFVGATDQAVYTNGVRTAVTGSRIGAAWGSATADAADIGILTGPAADDLVVGGDTAASGNELVGSIVGVLVSSVDDATVRGNHIGYATAPSVTGGDFGVRVDGNSDGVTIGHDSISAARNQFDDLTGPAVDVRDGATGVTVAGNVFRDTGPNPVDLQPGGATANDPDDADTGVNGLQNFPVPTGALVGTAGALTVNGTLDSTASTTFTVRAWLSDACATGGHGPGTRFLGSFTTATNASGDKTFSHAFGAALAETGDVVVLSATSPTGDSSELSACRSVAPSPPVNTVAPTVVEPTSVRRPGSIYTLTQGTWTGAPPIVLGDQWLRCAADGTACVPIVGATGNSHTATADDVGHSLRVRETATNAAPTASEVESAASAPILPPIVAPVLTDAPAGTITVDSVSFGASGESGATIRCALDGAAPAACPLTGGEVAYDGLSNAAHTIDVDQVGVDGAVSPEVTVSFTVDVPPAVTPTPSPTPTLTASPSPTPTPSPAATASPTPEPEPEPEPLPLRCSGREITIIELGTKGKRVLVRGLALLEHAGKTVSIRAGAKRIGTAIVGADGTFSATVRRPKGKRRLAATVDGKSSAGFALQRRFVILRRKLDGDSLVVTARVRGAKPGSRVTIRRALSCKTSEQIGTARVGRRGAVTLRLPLPTVEEGAASFRATSPVGKGRTFTLPIVVTPTG